MEKGSTFEEIFLSYENYVLKHYGPNSIIIFDGYPQGPSTKDTTYLRRRCTKAGKFVNITRHMKLNMKKGLFLYVLNNSDSGIQAIQDDAVAD